MKLLIRGKRVDTKEIVKKFEEWLPGEVERIRNIVDRLIEWEIITPDDNDDVVMILDQFIQHSVFSYPSPAIINFLKENDLLKALKGNAYKN